MRISLLWAVIVALPIMVAADSRPFGAEQTQPELLGGPDNPPEGPKAEDSKSDPGTGKPGAPDMASKPWRAIDVDDQAPAKTTKPRRKKAARPPRRQTPASATRRQKTVADRRPAARPLPAPARARHCVEPLRDRARYRTVVERVVVAPERVIERLRPARYGTVREHVAVKPAQRGHLVYPAQFRTVRERVLVRAAERRVVTMPARYRDEYRHVTVTGPRHGWVRERIGNRFAWVPATLPPATRVQLVRVKVANERRMVVDEPAVYETRTRRVRIRPERREPVTIEAEYRTVSRRVLVEPARRERVVVPARYRSVKRRIRDGHRDDRAVPQPSTRCRP
jgi:hypothetical protein